MWMKLKNENNKKKKKIFFDQLLQQLKSKIKIKNINRIIILQIYPLK